VSQARNDAEDLDEDFAQDEPQDAVERKATRADRKAAKKDKSGEDEKSSGGRRGSGPKKSAPASKKPAAKKKKRTSPALFYRQIVAEMRKVVWPTRSELSTYTVVVIVFVMCIIGIVAAMDYGISKAVAAVFG
jgi:preprotein translocase subunit SecE